MSNGITINVAGPVTSLFTTFQTPVHFLDTKMHENKADRHKSKRTILLSFYNSADSYIVLLHTTHV